MIVQACQDTLVAAKRQRDLSRHGAFLWLTGRGLADLCALLGLDHAYLMRKLDEAHGITPAGVRDSERWSRHHKKGAQRQRRAQKRREAA